MDPDVVKILLVEDDEDDCFLVRDLLDEIEPWESELDWATSFEEALERIEGKGYDVYLLDYNLGRHSGIDLLGALARHQVRPPAIMLTGQRERSRDLAAMEAGATDFLVKGQFDADMLERSIRYALERKKVERHKDEFVSIVNHELRTPLTSIKGSLDLILGGLAGEVSEGVTSMLNVANRNCERLLRIVNDVLDIQRIQVGKLDLECRPLNIGELVEQAIAANEGYARVHGVTFRIGERAGAELWVDGDEGRLFQVMANLLSNAAKFSPKGGVVTVAVKRCDEEVRVEVTDQGPGIPEAFRSSIFDPFVQAGAVGAARKGGSGLGLNIARSIVELHNGRIGFETELEGGTTFHFTLPLLPHAQPAR